MKRNKYRARKCEADGYKFDSLAEERRYQQLKLLERAGKISGLKVHPTFPLTTVCGTIRLPILIRSERYKNGRAVKYEADFAYWTNDKGVERYVVEDVKGQDTPLSRHKRAHVEAEYGVAVTVIKMR